MYRLQYLVLQCSSFTSTIYGSCDSFHLFHVGTGSVVEHPIQTKTSLLERNSPYFPGKIFVYEDESRYLVHLVNIGDGGVIKSFEIPNYPGLSVSVFSKLN